jgi:hypothetical protein
MLQSNQSFKEKTMSDQFEHDFDDATDEAAAAANTANEILGVGEVVEPATAPVEDDFFAESAVEEIPQVDPNTVVTLIPSSAESKYVTIERPTSIIELLSMASLRFEGEFTCFLGQSELKLNDLVPGGSTVTIAGKVKGG